MSRLETVVKLLEKQTEGKKRAVDLSKQGYSAAYRSMTKRIGDMIIYYREGENGLYDFECVIREAERGDAA